MEKLPNSGYNHPETNTGGNFYGNPIIYPNQTIEVDQFDSRNMSLTHWLLIQVQVYII